jgi:hypothetical protein
MSSAWRWAAMVSWGFSRTTAKPRAVRSAPIAHTREARRSALDRAVVTSSPSGHAAMAPGAATSIPKAAATTTPMASLPVTAVLLPVRCCSEKRYRPTVLKRRPVETER